MATYKGDIRYRYSCVKCSDPIAESAHEWCVKKGIPDLCWDHQPEHFKRSVFQFAKGLDKRVEAPQGA